MPNGLRTGSPTCSVSNDERTANPKLDADLWVLVPPVAAVVIGYVLWTLLMIVLRLPELPPWLSRLLHGGR
jgi:hypothetical protein